jgi:hypothetical protein
MFGRMDSFWLWHLDFREQDSKIQVNTQVKKILRQFGSGTIISSGISEFRKFVGGARGPWVFLVARGWG